MQLFEDKKGLLEIKYFASIQSKHPKGRSYKVEDNLIRVQRALLGKMRISLLFQNSSEKIAQNKWDSPAPSSLFWY